MRGSNGIDFSHISDSSVVEIQTKSNSLYFQWQEIGKVSKKGEMNCLPGNSSFSALTTKGAWHVQTSVLEV